MHTPDLSPTEQSRRDHLLTLAGVTYDRLTLSGQRAVNWVAVQDGDTLDGVGELVTRAHRIGFRRGQDPHTPDRRPVSDTTDAPDRDQPSAIDERFTVGLVNDVARMLEDHGYDRVTGRQHVELTQHLLHFLHGVERGVDRCHGGAR